MRIIAGEFRSRVLATLPGDNTRPTLDKVREAVFSRIGPYFEENQSVLDLFAGSGAVGLEALSRGMGSAVFNDASGKAVGIVKKNIESLKVNQRCTVFNLDYRSAINLCASRGYQFDLIYLDPPYRLMAINELVELIVAHGIIKDGGIIVAESLKEEETGQWEHIVKGKEVTYGISKITYLRYTKEINL